MKLYKQFKNKHKGERIIVLGCGESASLIKNGVKCLTIGVNDITRLITTDYTVIVNYKQSFAKNRWPDIANCKSKHIFTQLPRARLPIKDYNNKVVKIALGKRSGVNFSYDKIDYSSNSPYMAVVIAAYMGCTNIGLLGVDFTDNHFFGQTGPHVLNKRIKEIKREFNLLQLALAKKGINFVNLSPVSTLTLPKKNLLNFINKS